MACRFALPVSDAAELSVRVNAVPSNTKSMTEWGVRVWTEWASSRAVSLYCISITVLAMYLQYQLFPKVHIIYLLHS